MATIDKLLQYTFENKASDLHVSSGEKPMLRVDGLMSYIEAESVIGADTLSAYLKEIAPERNWKQFEEEKDTDFGYQLDGIARFRVNYFSDRNGPGAVFRVIPSIVPEAKDLGLSSAILDLCSLKKGLVLVTGPTGSGKSTTLAAMINHINQNREDHVITIEDPIEFVYKNNKCLINQREVGVHTGSFKRALRAALREDPDIVLVGEMRDLETVEIAIETAETGHLVFGTLHTTTAASTVNRIVDQFPADRQSQIRTMLAESLKAVIAQTLCRKVQGGRVAAQEILIANHAVASNIREGKIHAIVNAMQVGKQQGMQMLNDALLNLVEEGQVDAQEAFLRSIDRNDMKHKLESIGLEVNVAVDAQV